MARKKAPKKSRAPLVFIGVVALLLGLLALMYFPAAPAQSPSPQPSEPQPAQCTDGDARPCSVGACSGISTCLRGEWRGCRWNESCRPGTRAPCVKTGGCAYAVKVCNECGTAYGPCVPP